MKDFKWLHFSDLHLSNKCIDSKNAKSKLIDFIKEQRALGKLEYNYIFISGDIADKAVYRGTQEFFKKLFNALNPKNTKKDLEKVFWAVGNHDIQRDDSSLRYKIIKEIRDPAASATLAGCIDAEPDKMHGLEKRDMLLRSGMAMYTDNHLKILKREVPRSINPHKFYELDGLNLVVINTCLTSADDNDPHNLFIKSNDFVDIFKEIKDKNKPIFVLGHHGRDFFEMENMDELCDVFDDAGVDVYLCGHNHRLGYALLPDASRDIYQFTCGGGDSFANFASFSFMHGEFSAFDQSIRITPYSYREDGDKTWGRDERLNKRISSDKSYRLERLAKKSAGISKTAREEVAAALDDDISTDLDRTEQTVNEPFTTDYVNILHLSDLQFGITGKSSGKSEVAIQEREKVLEKQLISHLRNHIPKGWEPHIVVISGDLAWSATKSDYKKFGIWLKELLKVLNVPLENVILCTGNHDINSKAAEKNSVAGKISVDKAKRELLPDAIENDAIKENFNEFISFCKGKIDKDIVIEPLNDIPENESVDRYLFGFRDILGIRFNVLNTSWYCGNNRKKESSIPDKENLWIGTGIVQVLSQSLPDRDKFSVTVFHHPFDWLNPKEGDDNAYVKACLLKLSDIILCGHVHTKLGEPNFEHNRTQIFQSGALWDDTKYIPESRIIGIDKPSGKIRQLTLEYNPIDEKWENGIRQGPNKDHSYPINIPKHMEGTFKNA